jgi:hypothetical protein
VFLINSAKNMQLGFQKYNRSYLVGFPNRDNAKYVQKYVSSLTKCDFRLKEKLEGQLSIVDLSVTKKICINDLPSTIKEVPLEEYISYTLVNNISILFAIDIQETRDQFNIESVLIEAPRTIDAFKKYNKMK